VAVAHACGHDGHTAILLTVAEILAAVREKLPGTVVFYFQPAEEGPGDFVPDGKNTWGARMMIHEGAMRSPRPDAVFGLHLWAKLRAGEIAYRPGPTLAGSDDLRVSVFGKQTHAASPWDGVDPIVASAHAILGVQTVMSRRVNHAASPTVVSIGTIRGGTRYNIIPDRIDMEGTIRTYDPLVRRATHEDVRRAIERSVEAMGARAAVTILEKYAVTVNDVGLTVRSVPSLEWAARHPVIEAPLANGSEDFSFMAQEAPGFFFFLGATERAKDPAKAAPNHSPEFEIDEATLSVGVRALSALATDFLVTESAARSAPRAR
jgi:amidohydrolase